MVQVLTSVNPATGAVLAEYPVSSPQEIRKALKNAKQAFYGWRKKSFEGRAEVLKNIATVLRERKNELAALASREMGKPFSQSMAEVAKCAMTLEFYAENGARFLRDKIVETDARKS